MWLSHRERRHDLVAARLTEKALGRGHRVFINCDSRDQLDTLDDYLWRFKPSSFVPHCLASSDADEQVVLGFDDAPARTMTF